MVGMKEDRREIQRAAQAMRTDTLGRINSLGKLAEFGLRAA
jgi:hypothetical protein